ncbi:HNH/ENDO VII family nuclease, partial [Microbacterium sp. 22242]|uniref:HNH/ENDO VII family nuclease n=1 Tax=Microbacterium sp. 22242 TaxID=3453896 RepID=UPI003F8785C8
VTPPNPLVAGPVDTTSPLQGTFLLEDGEALVSAIKSGDWVAGGFAAFSAVMDTVAAVSDPLGSLIAAGLGWLMEHLQPLKGWLNDLTGDSGAVAGFAQTWTNVGAQLRRSASDLSTVLGDLDAADGAAVRAYLVFQRDVVKHLQGAASWADGMAAGMQMASTIVQVVHDLVRDSLAQLVGSLISYAAELVFSLGLATPLVIEQASTRVSALAAKFSKKIPDLVAAIRKLGELVEKLKALFKRFGDTADRLLHGGKDVPKRPDGTAPYVVDKSKWDTSRPYQSGRPSYRKGVVEDVWAAAEKRAWETPPYDGKVRDPLTNEVITWKPGESRKDVWDMGHIPGAKYEYMHDFYMRGGMTKEEFLDWYNNPNHYVPELPSSNRSHRNE